ncbi:MAG: hypothetical protein ACRDLQ_09930 [Solirubrobacterales bacterium]
MRRLAWAPVLLITALLSCGTAWAAPVTVNLRVEGSTRTLFEGPVTTDGKTIDKGDGPHACDGTSADPPQLPGPTMTAALDDASVSSPALAWQGAWSTFEATGDFFITQIGSEQGSGTSFWGTVLNYQPTSVGGCQQQVAQGDEALFALGDVFTQPLLRLRGDSRATVGVGISLEVTSGADRRAVSGARVTGVPGSTGADGKLAVTFDSPGVRTVKAEAPGSIRSNAWQVCVEAPGSGTCGGFTAPLVVPVSFVRDSSAPQARISGPRNGRRYRRGPRLLRGTARDDQSGVQEVKLSIRRHVRGRGCQWWSGRRERFVGRNCRKTFFFSIGNDARWSYLLPRRLGPGHYVIDVKVFDARRNRNRQFIRGENRTVFDVVRRKRARRVVAARAPARVQAMVVGRKGVIVEPLTVRARATVVRASGRRCAVAASTPLAALVAALGREEVGYAVRDYGSCERRRAGSSRQLFVTRIARERNSGQDGWVFKVDDRAPGRGAADSRVRSGDRMAWLYCEQDLETGGCQRSLRVVPARKSGLAGESLAVRVFGYDDKRSRRPVPGARVTLRSGRREITSALSAADGSALLTLPGAGRYALTATADGVVPAFPVRIRTR